MSSGFSDLVGNVSTVFNNVLRLRRPTLRITIRLGDLDAVFEPVGTVLGKKQRLQALGHYYEVITGPAAGNNVTEAFTNCLAAWRRKRPPLPGRRSARGSRPAARSPSARPRAWRAARASQRRPARARSCWKVERFPQLAQRSEYFFREHLPLTATPIWVPVRVPMARRYRRFGSTMKAQCGLTTSPSERFPSSRSWREIQVAAYGFERLMNWFTFA